VRADRLRADRQLARDLLLAATLGEKLEHLTLTRRQPRGGGSGTASYCGSRRRARRHPRGPPRGPPCLSSPRWSRSPPLKHRRSEVTALDVAVGRRLVQPVAPRYASRNAAAIPNATKGDTANSVPATCYCAVRSACNRPGPLARRPDRRRPVRHEGLGGRIHARVDGSDGDGSDEPLRRCAQFRSHLDAPPGARPRAAARTEARLAEVRHSSEAAQPRCGGGTSRTVWCAPGLATGSAGPP
jgi:hypothetical protein